MHNVYDFVIITVARMPTGRNESDSGRKYFIIMDGFPFLVVNIYSRLYAFAMISHIIDDLFIFLNLCTIYLMLGAFIAVFIFDKKNPIFHKISD